MSAPQAGGSRRTWLAAAAGLVVVTGGAGWALRRTQPPARAMSAAEAAFWQQAFAQVDGQPLAMAAFKGQPLLLNFWATWCPPCIEELPLLSAFYTQNKAKSWQVVGLAVDQPSSVQRFLSRSAPSFPVAMAGGQGTELVRSLGNLSGGLPFTVVFGADGLVQHRKMGKVNAADLAAWGSANAL